MLYTERQQLTIINLEEDEEKVAVAKLKNV